MLRSMEAVALMEFRASAEDMAGIAKLCVEHDLIVITDEIYGELRYDDEKHVSIAS